MKKKIVDPATTTSIENKFESIVKTIVSIDNKQTDRHRGLQIMDTVVALSHALGIHIASLSPGEKEMEQLEDIVFKLIHAKATIVHEEVRPILKEEFENLTEEQKENYKRLVEGVYSL